jgi:hypothetical protein
MRTYSRISFQPNVTKLSTKSEDENVEDDDESMPRQESKDSNPVCHNSISFSGINILSNREATNNPAVFEKTRISI